MEVVPVAENPALSRKRSRKKIVGSEVDGIRNSQLNGVLIRYFPLGRAAT